MLLLLFLVMRNRVLLTANHLRSCAVVTLANCQYAMCMLFIYERKAQPITTQHCGPYWANHGGATLILGLRWN